ncbi:MAG: hypothetical protein EXR98_05510 [Gemmataceae bacterium]|nr:hypothetical protein [Gemmataceae bacterium]
MSRHLIIGWLILVASAPFADAQTKRRVFVLHSGMHIILAPLDKDHASRTLKANLAERGVAERDLVAIANPFAMATVKEMIPRQGLILYVESADPASRSSQEAYLRLDAALKAHSVSKNDEIVWIGHSAGGQIGMTMAHLAHNLAKYPELAKKTQAYRFDTVITLGAAVGSNPTPADVKLRHYHSPADTMIFFLCKHGNVVAESVKSKVQFRVCYDLGPKAKVRVFPGIEHMEWYDDDAVLKSILREFELTGRPAWRRPHADAATGVGLSQLFAQALEAEFKISLE